jgi:hypothetical protein
MTTTFAPTAAARDGIISIRLESTSWSSGTDHAAVVEVVPQAGDKSRPATGKKTASIGVNAVPAQVSVPPGKYTVRIYLPNGDVLAEAAQVSAGGTNEVVFEMRPSPHEWLGSESALGAVQNLPTLDHVRALDSLRTTAPPVETRVTRGGRATRSGAKMTAEALSRVTQAIVDIEGALTSMESISGIENVTKITGWREVTNVNKARTLQSDGLTPPVVTRWWSGATSLPSTLLGFDFRDERNAILRSTASIAGRSDFIEGTQRAFAIVQDPTESWHYAVLPEGWVRTSHSGPGLGADAAVLMTVVIDSAMRGASDTAPPARWRCAPVVEDVEAMSYLGFLHAGQSAATSVFLDQAHDFLFEKVANPVAAAAGAFGLLATDEKANAARYSEWRKWIRNLYNWFPNLPDGAIAMARMYLRYGEGSSEDDIDVEKLRDFTLEAVRRGMPYLSLGITWLSEMLVMVVRDDEEHRRTGLCVDETRLAHRLVAQLLRMTDTSQFFTSLDVGPVRP